VKAAVVGDYHLRLRRFFVGLDSHLGRLIETCSETGADAGARDRKSVAHAPGASRRRRTTLPVYTDRQPYRAPTGEKL
jgi:hypothetical protein